jgi:protease PrsW
MSAPSAPVVRPTPLAARAGKSLRLPMFWLLVALLLVGAVRVGALMDDAFTRYPVATLAAIALFALYAVPFWFLIGALDYLEREPPLLMATAFAWGALVATSNAIPGSTALHDILAKTVSPEFSADWGPAIAGPTVEEVLKTLGVVAVVLIARAQVNSVLDGVVYGALVGLGFEIVEDIVYAVSAVALAGGGDRVAPVVATFFLRGFLAGLWSHMLFSALAGAGIGYLVVHAERPLWKRIGVAVAGFAAAWSCHFLWNSPLLADGPGYGGWGVLAGLVLKGVPPLVVLFVVVRAARHREGDYYAAQLVALDEPLVATEEELRVLGVGRLRAQARRYAYARSGTQGRRAVRRLQRAQARLAVALSRASSSDVAHWRGEVLAQRRRLMAIGHSEAVPPAEPRNAAWTWLGRVVAAGVGVFAVALIWTAIQSLGGA